MEVFGASGPHGSPSPIEGDGKIDEECIVRIRSLALAILSFLPYISFVIFIVFQFYFFIFYFLGWDGKGIFMVHQEMGNKLDRIQAYNMKFPWLIGELVSPSCN